MCQCPNPFSVPRATVDVLVAQSLEEIGENDAQTSKLLREQVLKASPRRNDEQVIEVPKTSDDVAVPVQFVTPLKTPTHVTDDIIDEHIFETILVPF